MFICEILCECLLIVHVIVIMNNNKPLIIYHAKNEYFFSVSISGSECVREHTKGRRMKYLFPHVSIYKNLIRKWTPIVD